MRRFVFFIFSVVVFFSFCVASDSLETIGADDQHERRTSLPSTEPHRQSSGSSIDDPDGDMKDQKQRVGQSSKAAIIIDQHFLENPVVRLSHAPGREFGISFSDDVLRAIAGKDSEAIIAAVQAKLAELIDKAKPSLRVQGYNLSLNAKGDLCVKPYLGNNAA